MIRASHTASDPLERDIDRALGSREATHLFLVALRSAPPDEGPTAALRLFARLATEPVEWLEGELRVALVDGGNVTVVEVMEGLGGGLWERVFPAIAWSTPFSEFVRAVERRALMGDPLRLHSRSARRAVFGAAEIPVPSVAPPVLIGDASLSESPSGAPPSAPPRHSATPHAAPSDTARRIRVRPITGGARGGGGDRG